MAHSNRFSTTGAFNAPYSIYASDFVGAKEFNAFSDSRIKQGQSGSDSENDLAMLLAIKVTDYHYIDTLKYGDNKKKGLIAQQVETVFPQAINKSKNFIPDIYTLCEDLDYQPDLSQLTVRLNQSHALRVGDKVRFMLDVEGAVEKTVFSIEGDHAFTVNEWKTPLEKVFVYGKQVDDFCSIDYNRILMLCISAAQVQEGRLQQLEKEKSDLQENYNELKTQLAQLLEKK